MKALYFDSSDKESDIIQQFRVEDGPVVMLAGIFIHVDEINFSCDLTAASRIYLMEPYLSPEIEARMIDLVHRIGQDKIVNVVKLIMHNSIEEKILELQDIKREREREAFDVNGNRINKDDLEFIMGAVVCTSS